MGEIIDNAKGRTKQAVGGLTGNQKLELDGAKDILKSKAAGAVRTMKDALKTCMAKLS
jgi:uncharacterized protein YjbJ (UPF0337 family)